MVFRLESKTVVRNTDYFRAVESDLRTAMKRFETMLLPIAEQAARDACVKVKEHPKEGYYTETTSLSRYFDILRSLQENFSPIITDSIRLLHEIYSHRVFGLGKAVRTAISDEALFPAESPAIISPVADPVSMASAKVQPNWTIDGIMDALVGIKLGTCLVGLAILVDSKENIQVSEQRRYNPLATCMACETTVLSRHKSTWRGGGSSKSQVDWQVDRAVEEYGNALIAAYNDLFTKGGESFSIGIGNVTPDNILSELGIAPAMERCVNLNIYAIKRLYYHWAIEKNPESGLYIVRDFNAGRIITTQEYHDNPDIKLGLSFLR